MKFFKLNILVLLVMFIFTGCKKEVSKIVTRKNGDWKVITETQKEYTNGILTNTINDKTVEKFVFKDDGTGEYYLINGNKSGFSWNSEKGKDEITLCEDFSGTKFCFTYKVTEYNKKKQKWIGESIDNNEKTEYIFELEAIK